jgi:hypothetical protein
MNKHDPTGEPYATVSHDGNLRRWGYGDNVTVTRAEYGLSAYPVRFGVWVPAL